MKKKKKKKTPTGRCCANCGYHGVFGSGEIWCDYIGHEGVSRAFQMGVPKPKPGKACRLWKDPKEVPDLGGFNSSEFLTEPVYERTYRGMVSARAYRQIANERNDGARIAYQMRDMLRHTLGKEQT